jgi:hypothetical protein
MAVVSEASAKDLINTNPQNYIKAFGTLIPDDYSKKLWFTFSTEQKSDYIKWFFNKDDPLFGNLSKLNENRLLTLLESNGAAGDIFLARFPDKQYNSDSRDDVTAITAVNVYDKAVELLKFDGGSRRRRQRTRKYKKSKRIFRSKNRQTRRR